MNCVQNQVTIANRVLLRDRVAGFIITGGQDNVQSVAGQMLRFLRRGGLRLPAVPYIAHSRGWSAEDMEKNVIVVQGSQDLHDGAPRLPPGRWRWPSACWRRPGKPHRAGREGGGPA